MRRTTRLFTLLIGEDAGDIGIKGSYRPEGLIHRTSDGTPVKSSSTMFWPRWSCRLSTKQPLSNKDADPKDFRLPDFTIDHRGQDLVLGAFGDA